MTEKSKKSVKICPKCRSADIQADFSAHSFAQGSVFNKYKCNGCGFEGIFFPETESK